jgi:hypothetical protein
MGSHPRAKRLNRPWLNCRIERILRNLTIGPGQYDIKLLRRILPWKNRLPGTPMERP